MNHCVGFQRHSSYHISQFIPKPSKWTIPRTKKIYETRSSTKQNNWIITSECPIFPIAQATVPSFLIAANALLVAWSCHTSLNSSCTDRASPPEAGLPQQTTRPSTRRAAKAWLVAWICCTVFSWSWTFHRKLAQDLLEPTKTPQPSVGCANLSYCLFKPLGFWWFFWTCLCPLVEKHQNFCTSLAFKTM